jgi:hypothetical protein
MIEFWQWFNGISMQREGLSWSKDLYFLYLIELRPLSEIHPFFEHPGFQQFPEMKPKIQKRESYFCKYFVQSHNFFSIFMELICLLTWGKTTSKLIESR